MLTATLADLFYNAGLKVQKSGISSAQKAAWAAVLGGLKGVHDADTKAVVKVFTDAGDSVMQRIYAHIKDDDFHISEQIDKNDGSQISAENLTWS